MPTAHTFMCACHLCLHSTSLVLRPAYARLCLVSCITQTPDHQPTPRRLRNVETYKYIAAEVIHGVSNLYFHRYRHLIFHRIPISLIHGVSIFLVSSISRVIATMSMYLNLWSLSMSSIHDHCQCIHFNTFYISAFFLDWSQRVPGSCRCVSTMGWWPRACLRAHALDRRFWRLDNHAGAGGRRRTIQEEVDGWAPALLFWAKSWPWLEPRPLRLFVCVNRRIKKTTRIVCSCVHVSFIICIGDISFHMLKHIHIAHRYLLFLLFCFLPNRVSSMRLQPFPSCNVIAGLALWVFDCVDVRCGHVHCWRWRKSDRAQVSRSCQSQLCIKVF